MATKRTDRQKRIIFALIALLVSVPVLCPPALAAEREYKIVIVKSWDVPEYNTALEGFFESLAKERIPYESATFDLKGRANEIDLILGKFKTFKPDLIVTVGSRATGAVSGQVNDIPIVFLMVLYPLASTFVADMARPGANVTGAAIDVPIEMQLKTLSKIVPRLRRVGVLYSPRETLPVIQEARRVAESMNIELLAEEVNTESDVPDTLSNLRRKRIDALWSVADGKVFTRPSTRYIIEYVVRHGIPFMGPHNGFVKAGALVALTADYRDNGRQAGQLSIQVLKGSKPGEVPVATPRSVDMALNLRVANHIGVRISPDMLEEASQVFE